MTPNIPWFVFANREWRVAGSNPEKENTPERGNDPFRIPPLGKEATALKYLAARIVSVIASGAKQSMLLKKIKKDCVPVPTPVRGNDQKKSPWFRGNLRKHLEIFPRSTRRK